MLDTPDNGQPHAKRRTLLRNAFSDDKNFEYYYNSSYDKKSMRKGSFAQMNESENLIILDDDQPPAKRGALHCNTFTVNVSFVVHNSH